MSNYTDTVEEATIIARIAEEAAAALLDQGGADFSGPVPMAIPTDPLLASDWHLGTTAAGALNQRGAWLDYSGRGVKIAIVDDGVDYLHPDLAPHYAPGLDYDARQRDLDPYPAAGDNHGTAVTGVLGAAGNGTGQVGVAFDATLAGYRIGYGANGSPAQVADAYVKQVANGMDISNNSWGYSTLFTDSFKTGGFASVAAALEQGVVAGRAGLGSVFVFAAGNYRSAGDDVNHHNYQNSPYTIAVAATDSSGRIASFSTPGAALLVSAPGVSIATTDIVGAGGYSSTDFTAQSGTSFATPVVSGVIALMLEANPLLGYRDVQEILAYSAKQTDPTRAGWTFNHADNANGGGLHFSNDYGFGLVDATAAVRLAETWTTQSTAADRTILTATRSPGLAITDNNATGVSDTVSVAADVTVDRIEVDLNIVHTNIGDLIVTLTSPDGTSSTLINRPGVTGTGRGSTADSLSFVTSSNAFWGEHGTGTWKLTVSDRYAGDVGTLSSWSLKLTGDAVTADDTYVYTNEYGALSSDAGHRTLTDGAGSDTINAAAVTGATVLDLRSGGTIGGGAVAITAGTVIETAFLGDGNDSVTGNDAGNRLSGGRGDDTLMGGGGTDLLEGGSGNDLAVFGGNVADYRFSGSATDLNVTALAGSEGVDRLVSVERVRFADISGSAADALAGLLVATPVPPPPPPVSPPPPPPPAAGGGTDTIVATVSGTDGNDTIRGGTGNDVLDGRAGADRMEGGAADDIYIVDNPGDFTADLTTAAGGIDTVRSSITWSINRQGYGIENLVLTGSANIDATGNGTANRLTGNAGANVLDGLSGADTMEGGAGDDTYVVDNLADVVTEVAGEGIDTVRSTVSYTLGASQENLVLTGSIWITGAGNELANQIAGNGQANKLDGAGGDDTLTGGAGNDTLDGGAGDDLAIFSGTFSSYQLTGTSSQMTVTGADGADRLTNIERLQFSDRLLTAVDALNGGASSGTPVSPPPPPPPPVETTAPTQTGTAGNDTLRGTDGNDVLDGGAGADRMEGGAGDDIYVVDNAGDFTADLTTAAGGIDAVHSAISWSIAKQGYGIENLVLIGGADIDATGNGTANRLTGNSGANLLDGSSGADSMEGGAGDDTYLVDNAGDVVAEAGGEGTDTVRSTVNYSLGANQENLMLTGSIWITGTGNELDNQITGNSQANKIEGGSGNDTLIGGGGKDSLSGGAGDDVFQFRTLSDAGAIIKDLGQGDHIDLAPLIPAIGWSGGDPFASGIVVLAASGANCLISIDADGAGAGAATVLATVEAIGITQLTHDYFRF